jgi:GNAT superfamily N-acetyltransferase
MELRGARPGDVEPIVRVLRAARERWLPYAPSVHGEKENGGWVGGTLIPSGGVTVAVLKGKVIGVLAVSRKSGVGWIDQLYVQPGWERRGVGSTLLAEALKTLPRPVRLYTFEQNQGARRFYERWGFVAIRFGDGSGNEEGVPDVLYELE